MDQTVCEDVGLAMDRLGRIDGWMQRWVDSGRLAGTSDARQPPRPDRLRKHCYGLADRERGTAR